MGTSPFFEKDSRQSKRSGPKKALEPFKMDRRMAFLVWLNDHSLGFKKAEGNRRRKTWRKNRFKAFPPFPSAQDSSLDPSGPFLLLGKMAFPKKTLLRESFRPIPSPWWRHPEQESEKSGPNPMTPSVSCPIIHFSRDDQEHLRS